MKQPLRSLLYCYCFWASKFTVTNSQLVTVNHLAKWVLGNLVFSEKEEKKDFLSSLSPIANWCQMMFCLFHFDSQVAGAT